MFLYQQELKKAILEDLVSLGRASGLHSFEQVNKELKRKIINFMLFLTECVWYDYIIYFRFYHESNLFPYILPVSLSRVYLLGEEHLRSQPDVLHRKWPPDTDPKGQTAGAEGVLQDENRPALQRYFNVKMCRPISQKPLWHQKICFHQWPALVKVL